MMRNLILHKNMAVACGLALTTALTSLPAFAADNDTQHLRGEITSVSNNSFKLQAKDGTVHEVKLSSDTAIAIAMPGDLNNIEEGTFIGTANVKRDGDNTALEMVIFPPSMTGTGLGDYGWDLSPSMVNKTVQTAKDSDKQSGGSMTAGSSMTNGTVTSKSSGSDSSGSMTAGSSMTNGTVTQSANDSDKMTLTVDYGQGSKTIVVPKDVPTVKVAPGQVSDLETGEHAFAIVSSNGKKGYTAKKIIVGQNGTVPPM